MKRAWFSRRALVIIGTLLLGVWIRVLLEDAMNVSGNPQGLFVSPVFDDDPHLFQMLLRRVASPNQGKPGQRSTSQPR
ncbi:MAG TPA: hypothetical protein VMU69_25740 [Bradyrhizobium sp.]|nr:hypothetical protein [Bradyrhizobium sp.]